MTKAELIAYLAPYLDTAEILVGNDDGVYPLRERDLFSLGEWWSGDANYQRRTHDTAAYGSDAIVIGAN